MVRRARMLAVLSFLLAGAIGIISSTQTWLVVERSDAAEPLLIVGADALTLLAPLSLAVLALGAALSIAGIALRYGFAVLAAGAAIILIMGTTTLLFGPPRSVAAKAVAEATGLSGDAALYDIVDAILPTGWPAIALAAWVLLLLASAFVCATAPGWKSGGRRYRSASEAEHRETGPQDAVDSWDELSHGTDPTDSAR